MEIFALANFSVIFANIILENIPRPFEFLWFFPFHSHAMATLCNGYNFYVRLLVILLRCINCI